MRSVRSSGVSVYAATAGPGASILDRSRSCAAATRHDSSDATVFCRSVIDWIDRIQPGGDLVVIPLADRLVEYLDSSRSIFPDRFRLAIPPKAVVDRLIAKDRSLAVADEAGLNVPAWTHVATEDDIDQAVRLPLPVAVRPSSWAATGEHSFKIVVYWDRQALSEGLRVRLRDGAQMIAQEYLEAPEDAVEFSLLWRSKDGSRTEVVTGRKRRQAGHAGGVMVWGETASLPDVAAASLRFLDESGFTGLGGAEFIKREDGLWFIEFNPRLEAIHFLANRAGVDTVQLEFADHAGLTTERPLPERQTATAWIGTAWLQRFLDDPDSRVELLADRWRFARSPSRIRAVWSWKDPIPGLFLTAKVMARAMLRLVERRPIWGRRP